jgi:DNA (cytosine-5)-methyltransferase 1
MSRPIAVDLFAGVGGLTLGFEQAGFDVLAAVEVDPVHCAVHRFNFPHCEVICNDVTKVTAQEIRTRSLIKDRKITVGIGGSPCQGFSLMGKRALDDPRNFLVLQYIRLISELDCEYFIFENVKGLTVGNHRFFIDEIIQRFEQLGYSVEQDYSVLNALGYGVPQHRERFIMLGCKKGLPLPKYPQPRSTYPTVWAALRDLPEASDYPILHQRCCTPPGAERCPR